MSSADDKVITASDEREVDVIPETLPPGSSLPEGSVVAETFVRDSVIHETYQDALQDYDDLHFPDSPIEESGSIIPDSQGGRLLTDEEVTRIVQRHFPQRKPVAVELSAGNIHSEEELTHMLTLQDRYLRDHYRLQQQANSDAGQIGLVQAAVAHGDVQFIQQQPQPQLPKHRSPVSNDDHRSVILESVDEQVLLPRAPILSLPESVDEQVLHPRVPILSNRAPLLGRQWSVTNPVAARRPAAKSATKGLQHSTTDDSNDSQASEDI